MNRLLFSREECEGDYLVDFELERLAQHGMQLGDFGQRILKAETALAAIRGGWID